MEVFKTLSEMRQFSETARCRGKKIGFVPTMGALHEGHLSLIREAKKENDLVVVSIFVNPTQFAPNEDLKTYPRPFQKDLALLESEKADVLFYPSVEEMYGKNGSLTSVVVRDLPRHLCGLSRPTHFEGVGTVVTKLFAIVLPHRAYFGRKDYQQMVIVRQIVQDLNLFVEIVGCPIVREPDGLALSSRNKYLSDEERTQAPVLYRALQLASQKLKDGETSTDVLKALIKDKIKQEAPQGRIDYVEIVDPLTLESLEEVYGEAVAALAVYFGKTRLIDNIALEIK